MTVAPELPRNYNHRVVVADEMQVGEVPRELALDEGYWRALIEEDMAFSGGRGRSATRRPGDERHPDARNGENLHAPRPAASHPRPGRELLSGLRAGDIRRGVVTNLTNFGAFIDIGGFEGLAHVSEVSWSRVAHPRDALNIGQTVEAFVLSVDAEAGRLALSLKRVKPNPWEGIEARFAVGRVTRGVVTNVVDFGAFVRVEDDLEGLLHVSELGEGHALHPRNVLREGQIVLVRVIGVDGEHHRLALSLNGVE